MQDWLKRKNKQKKRKNYVVLTLYSANFGVHFLPVSSFILFKLVGHRYPHVPGVNVIFSIKSVAAFVKGSPLGPNPLGRIQLFRLHSSLRKPCNINWCWRKIKKNESLEFEVNAIFNIIYDGNFWSMFHFLTFWKRARLFGLPQLIPQFNVFGYGVVSLPGGIANKPNAWKPPKAVKIDNMIRKLQHRFARKPVNGGVNINRIWKKDKRTIIICKTQTSNNF